MHNKEAATSVAYMSYYQEIINTVLYYVVWSGCFATYCTVQYIVLQQKESYFG